MMRAWFLISASVALMLGAMRELHRHPGEWLPLVFAVLLAVYVVVVLTMDERLDQAHDELARLERTIEWNRQRALTPKEPDHAA